jgi:hypothetical protein
VGSKIKNIFAYALNLKNIQQITVFNSPVLHFLSFSINVRPPRAEAGWAEVERRADAAGRRSREA